MQSKTVEDIFESVSRQLLSEHPSDERGRMLHSPGLKTAGKFFAFATTQEVFVKLPAARVDEVIASGQGQPCEPRRGRPMREWVRLSPADERSCTAYLLEARAFVARQSESAGPAA
jgi:hypothetical protein